MQKHGNLSAKLAAFFVALLGAVMLTACAGADEAEPTSEPRMRSGTETPRVVALDWRYEEILVAIGVEPVGIVEIGQSTEPATLAGQLTGITSVGQAKQPNLEVIQSLEPDLILASPTRHEAIMPQLSEIAETKAYSDATYIDVLDSMDEIAALIGGDAPEKADEVRTRILDKVDQAKNAVQPGTRAALVGWSNDTLYTWIDQSFSGSLLTDAGYDYGYTGERSNIESKTDVAELTGDKLPEMNLDVVFLYNDIEGFKSSPYASVVDNIVEVEQDTWSRARGPLAAEAMLDQIIETAQK
ncbi:ABC transporter substrate-binding protein [Corynebacterium mayonis]|uniref:ABC transporter substrate-binding protein n=1 Tax=Corynebacterium mayonis TaxID=3062461 RepID=UPI00314080BA